MKQTILITISLMALILFSGCSNDEQDNYDNNVIRCFDSYTICNLNGSDCTCEDSPSFNNEEFNQVTVANNIITSGNYTSIAYDEYYIHCDNINKSCIKKEYYIPEIIEADEKYWENKLYNNDEFKNQAVKYMHYTLD